MPMKFLDPKEAIKLLNLGMEPYRPKEIVELKEEIEGEIRAAEFACSTTGIIDEERVKKIVGMKLQLDALYGAWAQGKLS